MARNVPGYVVRSFLAFWAGVGQKCCQQPSFFFPVHISFADLDHVHTCASCTLVSASEEVALFMELHGPYRDSRSGDGLSSDPLEETAPATLLFRLLLLL